MYNVYEACYTVNSLKWLGIFTELVREYYGVQSATARINQSTIRFYKFKYVFQQPSYKLTLIISISNGYCSPNLSVKAIH